MKFRAGDLEFNASVVESNHFTSAQTGNPLQTMTIQFRAQKAGVHEAAVTEALQRQSGGLISLAEGSQPELEWRVRESNWTYVGTEPWGVNHHVWRIEQVERLACTRLIIGSSVALEPYDYVEALSADTGVLRLAARAAVDAETLSAIATVSGAVDVVREGVSAEPRSMRLRGYVWDERPDGFGLAVTCEDVHELRVTVHGFSGALADDVEDLLSLLPENLRDARHARRRVASVDNYPLQK